MEKLPEHCPGPPVGQADAAGETTTDIDLGKQLRRREEELQQLRSEVESYAGKLKTFQTLGNTATVLHVMTRALDAGLLFRAKFHLHQCKVLSLRGDKKKISPFLNAIQSWCWPAMI